MAARGPGPFHRPSRGALLSGGVVAAIFLVLLVASSVGASYLADHSPPIEAHAASTPTSAAATLPAVLSTLFVVNGTHAAGNVLPRNGYGSQGIAYDPLNHEVFVPQSGSSTLLAIDVRTGQIVGAVNTTEDPVAVAYDAANGNVYVSGYVGETVSVVDASTTRLVANIPLTEYVANMTLGCEAEGIAIDPVNGHVYVATPGCGGVVVLSGSTPTEIGLVGTDGSQGSSSPAVIAVDSLTGEIYVGGWWLGGIDVINASTDSITTTIPLNSSSSTSALGFDPQTGAIYDAQDDGVVNVINGTSHRIVASLETGGVSSAIAFDGENDYLYLTNPRQANLTAIDGTTAQFEGSISIPSGANSLVVPPPNSIAYVVDGSTNELRSVNLTTGASVGTVPMGEGPNALAYDPSSGTLLVQGAGMTGTTPVNPSTLATSAPVNLSGTVSGGVYDSAVDRMYFPQAGGALDVVNATSLSPQTPVGLFQGVRQAALDPSDGELYVTDAPGGCWNVNFVTVVSPASERATGNFTLAPGIGPIAYDPANGHLYVGNYSALLVLDPTTGTTLGSIAAPWIPQYIAYDSANGELYVLVGEISPSQPQAGILAIKLNGTSGTVVASIPIGGTPTGLAVDAPDGLIYASWGGLDEVSVVDAATNSPLENLSVGWDAGAMAYDDHSGLVFVANSKSGTISVIGLANATSGTVGSGGAGSRVTITVSETGLPTGTTWSVDANGTPWSSSGGPIDFTARPGTQVPFSIMPTAGFVPSPASGEINVGSSPVSLWIHFVSVPLGPSYSAHFQVSGLPPGDWWSITVDGTTNRTTGAAMNFTLPVGQSYRWSWNGSSCLSADPISGMTGTAGQETVVTVAPSSVGVCGRTGTDRPAQSPNTTLLSVVVLSAGAVALLLATVLWSRRRGRGGIR